jgi:hypothetical protein
MEKMYNSLFESLKQRAAVDREGHRSVLLFLAEVKFIPSPNEARLKNVNDFHY